MPSAASADAITRRRARRWARRLRSRSRAACRERGEAIEGTVAHPAAAFIARRAQRSYGQGQGYDRCMSAPPRIRIPRWVQLVVLPVALVLAFLLARTLGHVIFLFLTAAVIAFTLNPLVRDLTRLRLPRGLAVAMVYIVFAAAPTCSDRSPGPGRTTAALRGR